MRVSVQMQRKFCEGPQGVNSGKKVSWDAVWSVGTGEGPALSSLRGSPGACLHGAVQRVGRGPAGRLGWDWIPFKGHSEELQVGF